MDKALKSHTKKVDATVLKDILSTCTAFSSFSESDFDLLAKGAKRVFVPAGTHFLKQGEVAETATVIEHGRFIGLIPVRTGETLTFELGRGEIVTLAAMLAEDPSRGDLYALRDSTVITLQGKDFLACLTANSKLIKDYSAWAIEQTKRLIGLSSFQSRPQTFALLPTSNAPQIHEASLALMQALSETHGQGHLIDSKRIQEVFGCDPEKRDDFNQVRHKLTAWLEEQEAEGCFLLFVCDPTETNWTRWCLDQTDRIIVAAMAEDTAEIERIGQMFAGRQVAETKVMVDLILIQDQNTRLPRGSNVWMKLKCLRRHHQVRQGNATDFQRVARRISDRAVGLVLGGGGARGLAHIGVLQALEEAGVPVDVIGGTSMGSAMAAAYARGWAPQRILEFASKTFTDTNAVRDLDFPMISILAGRKLNRQLQSFFQKIDIADLWLPYFCISASLSEGEMVVHDRGLLWEKVRASCSLPGIFPPVWSDGQLLVDGGVMNNVPMDIMENRCNGGTIIAVNVGGGGAKEFDDSKHWNASGWSLLRQRFSRKSQNKRIANILDVMLWSTTISSKRYLQQLVDAGRVDLYLTPPVQDFQLLGFDAYEKLYQVGYEYARKELAAWEDLSKVVPSKSTNI
jgi:predicted acylesterase/phospholipase RssA/CRP-like cAMP-binding protein